MEPFSSSTNVKSVRFSLLDKDDGYQFLDPDDIAEKRARLEEINVILHNKRGVVEYLFKHSRIPRDEITIQTMENVCKQIRMLENEKRELSKYSIL